MKKNLLTTLFITLLLSVTQFCFAQISFGPRIGLNLATWAGVNNNAAIKPGLHIGGFAKLGLGEKLAFQPELLFSMKGAKSAGNTSSYSDAYAMNYLDIPLLLNVGKPSGMHFLIGAQPSLLLSAKHKVNSNGTKTDSDAKDFFNGFDIAPVIGFGYQAEGGFSTDLRFTYGVPDIIKDNAGNSQHNFNLQLTFGYTIGGN